MDAFAEPAAEVPVPPRPSPVAEAALPPGAWRQARPVRFSDCDPAGIVFTATFVAMMNDAVEAAFPAALGLDYHALLRDRRVGLGYATATQTFFRPAAMGDVLVFTVLVGRVGTGSASWRLHGHRGAEEVVRGDFVMVTTDLDRRRAIPLPDDLRAGLLAYRSRLA